DGSEILRRSPFRRTAAIDHCGRDFVDERIENSTGRTDNQLASGFGAETPEPVRCALGHEDRVACPKLQHFFAELKLVMPFADDEGFVVIAVAMKPRSRIGRLDGLAQRVGAAAVHRHRFESEGHSAKPVCSRFMGRKELRLRMGVHGSYSHAISPRSRLSRAESPRTRRSRRLRSGWDW